MSENRVLDDYVGEEVKVVLSNDDEKVGTLKSYEDDFSLTLTGDRIEEKPPAGHFAYHFIEGEVVYNGTNVMSVELWKGFDEDDEE